MSRHVRKVVVLGLDGLEPTLVERYMSRGILPHFASLKQCGGLSRVATTSPAQTPVAWSSFATGTNPGGHGIFDFLRRDPTTYLPDLALNYYEQPNRFTLPRAVNRRRGVAFWSILSEAGIPATVLRAPCTYPPDAVNGRMLSGMGVPDLRGGLGTATFFTTNRNATPGESERVVHLETNGQRSDLWSGRLLGPRNPRDGSELGLDFTIQKAPDAQSVYFQCPSAAPPELTLPIGEWSAWVRISFKVGLLQHVKGMVRLRLLGLDPQPTLYASPINFDCDAPLFPISSPLNYSRDLATAIGSYYTTGMVEDHAGLSNGRLDEAAFLDQCELAWNEREAMMLHELERCREGLFYCLFDTPDRVQHMFWRFLEPDHPANRDRSWSDDYREVIEQQYRRADAIVGKALEFADDDTLTIVLSDHGFGSFRRCVDLNAWLFENGLLALRDGLRPGSSAGDLLRGVDWSRTQAYALGLGGIYVNMRDREASGIVPEQDAPRLKAEIARGLREIRDRDHDRMPVRGVRPREEVYSGPFVDEAPDLLVHLDRGYRVSWKSSTGGMADQVIEDNTNAWAGDHIIDPALVPGVLLMNEPFRGENARLVDLAPTILTALGVPPAESMEGDSLR